MNKLSDREVDALSEHIAKNEFKDTTWLMKNKYSIPAFLDMLESWLRISGFVYRRDTTDSVQTFEIQHEW